MSSINNESYKEKNEEIKEISEPSCLISKIKSIHMLNTVFEYIKEESFKYKLFIHSKEFQRKLNINSSEFYLFKYIDKQKINLYSILTYNYFDSDPHKSNPYEKLLIKLNIKEDELKKYILYFFRKKLKEDDDVDVYKRRINIFSPIFDIFIKEGRDIFEKSFTIYINAVHLRKYNLKFDYISAFEKLNESNIKYSSLVYFFENNEDINCLNELKINFANIKTLNITKYITDKIFDININIFTNNDLLSNLINLYLIFCSDRIASKAFENLNNLKKVINLTLTANFDSAFILNLPNLQNLSLHNCYNITFEKNSCLNLKKLEIRECSINEPYSLIQFPELIQCYLDIGKCNKIFDFKSLKKLRELASRLQFFELLENPKLVKFEMIFNYQDKYDKKYLEKILLTDTIETASIILNNISDKDISEIQLKNNSIKILKLSIKKNINFNSIINFQDLFTNLTTFSVKRYQSVKKGKFEIIENGNSKINDLKVEIKYEDIKIYCGPFSKLKKIDIYIKNRIKNIKDSFPLFSDKCAMVFESLTNFRVCFECVNFEIIKNIYLNLDYMPNVKHFDFFFKCDIKIDKDFYNNFILKLLKLDLNYICLKYKDEGYSDDDVYLKEKQLLKIYPKFKTENMNNIIIQRLI